jgi:Fic family protein
MEMEVKMEFLNTTSVRITPEILSLIAEIDEFKGAWRAIGRIALERLSSLRRIATIESVGSSTRIEGARLTDREVEKLLANIRLGSFTTRDEQEVAGYHPRRHAGVIRRIARVGARARADHGRRGCPYHPSKPSHNQESS